MRGSTVSPTRDQRPLEGSYTSTVDEAGTSPKLSQQPAATKTRPSRKRTPRVFSPERRTDIEPVALQVSLSGSKSSNDAVQSTPSNPPTTTAAPLAKPAA